MRWLAEVVVDTSLLARFQRLVVVFLILVPTIAHTADEVGQAPDYAITKNVKFCGCSKDLAPRRPWAKDSKMSNAF